MTRTDSIIYADGIIFSVGFEVTAVNNYDLELPKAYILLKLQ